jgi:hypothetical protein
MKLRLILACALLVGCGSDPIPSGRMRLVQGLETDTWTRDPAPVNIEVEKQLLDGERSLLTTLTAPASEFTLDNGAVGRYDVLGKDANGAVQVRGTSLLLDPRGFAGALLPLYVARTGEFSRPDAMQRDVGEAPFLNFLFGRHLFAVERGGEPPVVTESFDAAYWDTYGGLPTFACSQGPCSFRSMAVILGSVLLGVGADFANWYDIEYGRYQIAQLPSGMTSFAEIAGGQTITGPEGSAFIVGGTRPNEPTDKVLAISKSGELSTIALVGARSGAAASYVEGRGLVVVGGSDTAAGAELLAPGATAFVPLAYPADATRGASLAVLDSARVLRLGGKLPDASPAATVELSLACGSGCAPTPRGVPTGLDDAKSFVLDAEQVLSVGLDATGETRALLLEGDQQLPVPLREPRRRASAARLPTGHVVIVGGTRVSDGSQARAVELFTPR